MEPLEKDQRLQELYLLQSVTQKINSILDLDVLLEEIVGDVLETFGYCRSGILLKIEGTNELEIAAVRGWSPEYHVKGDRFPIGNYGIIGHVAETGETYYAPDVNVDPYYQVSEESTNSELAIPLKTRGKLIGVFDIQNQKLDAFPKERIRVLETLAANISIAIENARLFFKERLEKERMVNELAEARKIQFNLFPKKTPVLNEFDITGICIPCQEVGGDWYDYIPFDDGRLGIVIADVSGKGMGAALLMSSTRSILRLIAKYKASPKEVLKDVNDILINDFPTTRFVTLIYGVLDPKKQNLIFANAGHLYPILADSSGSKFLETSKGVPLGISDTSFSECEVKFAPGTRLLFYTDGITEATNKSGEEYGMERLKEYFRHSSSSVHNILKDIKSFTEGYSFCDDVTLVTIEKNKN